MCPIRPLPTTKTLALLLLLLLRAVDNDLVKIVVVRCAIIALLNGSIVVECYIVLEW